jgi:hypothetical protein
MSKFRIIACCCFLILLQNAAMAQLPQPLTQDVFPPSPNASALAKFVDMPVSMASGVPQIGVPIYSYKGNGLKLSISLDYHAGGIRVEEIASDVGIGWALNAGGQVSRNVRGLPDDLKQNGYFYLGHLNQFYHYIQISQEAHGFLQPTDSLYRFYKNLTDSQSDIFSYSINGKSGKFIYGLDGNYISIPQSKVKIQRILSQTVDINYTLAGFIITDTDGTQYSFTKNDLLYNSALNIQGAYNYPTAWNLTKIVAPFKTDSITISYESYGLSYQIGKTETEYTHISGFVDPSLAHSSAVSLYNGNANRIKQINFPDSTHVVFNYESIARKDITAAGALKEIIISNGNKSYGYHLWHSYGIRGAYTAGTMSPAYRLQLDSVAQFNNTSYLPPYKFTYNGAFPYRLSTAQDYWGFPYDSIARANPNTLIPKIYNSADLYYDGADRRPDTIKCQLGALTQIQYPTGGITNYTYESNRGNTLLDEMIPQRIQVATGNLVTTHSQSFTVNRIYDSGNPINFNFQMTAWCSGTPTSACKFVYKIKNTAGDTTFASASFGYSELNTVKTVTVPIFRNGNYKLTWEFDDPSHCSCSDVFGMGLSYYQFMLNSADLAGGIRVKKIVSYDGISHANDLTKEYYYTRPNGTSSGSVSIKPKYDYHYTATNTLDAGQYLVRSSTAYHPLSGANGASVAYNMVTVKQNGNNGYLGKSVYYFTDYSLAGYPNCADSDGGPCPPFVTQPEKSYTIGLPLAEFHYDSSSKLLKKTTNTYNYISSNDQYFVDNYHSFKFLINEQSHENDPPKDLLFTWTDFYQETGRMEKTKEITVDYTTAPDSLLKETDYTYDPTFYNLKTSYTFDSKNQKIETRLYYPYDYTIAGAIGSMKTNNINDPVVSSEEWITIGTTPYIRKAALTDYGIFQRGIIRPSKSYSLHSIPPLAQTTIGAFNPGLLNRNTTYFIQDINYDKFDSKGNISQATNKVAVASFIWDMNKQRPIAKISNADSASVAYTSFESDGTGNWTIGSAARDLSTGITGNQSYNLSSGSISFSGLTTTKSYVVSYWSRNGSYTLTNGGTPKTGITLNGWTYYEHSITGTATLSISGSGNIDELRLYPSGAQMITYTHDALAGVTSIADAKNSISYYEYDGLLRLKNIKDQYGNILKNYCYNYAGSVGCPIVFTYFSAAQSATYYRSNCGANYVGSGVTYTIPANTYSSTISQADADSKATADKTANGQNYADANGTCTLCTGVAYKILNHNCELGSKVFTNSVKQGTQYLCTYHYEWSDGSHSTDYTELHATACAF